MNPSVDSFLLPLSLIYKFTEGKLKWTHLKTFCLLKLHIEERFELSKELQEKLCSIAAVSRKTLRSHLNLLKETNHLGYDPDTKIWYQRGKRDIPTIKKSKLSIVIRSPDLQHYQALFFAAVVGHKASQYFALKYKHGEPDLLNGGSVQGSTAMSKIAKGYAPVSISLLAKALNKCEARIFKLKAEAIELRLILRMEDKKVFHSQWGMMKGTPEFPAGRFRRGRQGTLSMTGIDLLKSLVHLKKEKK